MKRFGAASLPRCFRFSGIIAFAMALNLLMFPSTVSAQRIIDTQEECGSPPSPVSEEEVVKDICAFRTTSIPDDGSHSVLVLMHQYEERMLDHPLLEVPHQPPK